MFRLNVKQMLSIFMAGLMVQSSTMSAASSAVIVGSINTYGAVTVGQNTAAPESTLFAGDTVATQAGNAVVNYEQGPRVLLAKSSTAVFSPKTIELQRGQMSFQTNSRDVFFRATSLRLEPMGPKTSADVEMKDGKAIISVKEGSVRAVDPSGKALAVIPAGEAKLFAMAVPPSPPATPATPSASASAAPIPGGIVGVWVLVASIAAVTVGTITAQVLDEDDEVENRAVSPIRP